MTTKYQTVQAGKPNEDTQNLSTRGHFGKTRTKAGQLEQYSPMSPVSASVTPVTGKNGGSHRARLSPIAPQLLLRDGEEDGH